MKKVAEVVTRLEFGGVESILLNYINHINKNEFEFHVITQNINAEGCIKQFQEAGIKVHIVTHKRESIIKNVKETYQVLKNEKFDIVHSHMTLTNFYVLFLARLTGTKKMVSHSHNAFTAASLKQRIAWPVLKWLNRIAANVWVACGIEAGKFLFGSKAMEQGKVHIMNNAIDVDRFLFDEDVRRKIRCKHGLENEVCIGHIGRYMEQKNHKYLIDVFVEILKIIPNAKLLLIGVGDLKQQIQSYVKGLGIDNSVIYIGSITNTNEYYQAMDLFLLPSLYEGLPVVSVEAQTADLPCVISENVDKRCAITDNVEFLPIDIEPKIWAEKAVSMIKKTRSREVLLQVQKAHFDISMEAKEMESIYSD